MGEIKRTYAFLLLLMLVLLCSTLLFCVPASATGETAGPASTSGWSQQDAGITDGFWSVSAADELTAWLMGGQVLKTENAGVDWESRYNRWGYEITAVDADTAWFVNEYGIYRTTDGGQSWSMSFELPGPGGLTSFQYTGFDAVDADVAWLTGYMINLQGQDSMYEFVLRTVDGGNDWEAVRYSLLGSSPIVTCGRISAISASTAWVAVGPAIYKTTSGGKWWFLQYTLRSGKNLLGIKALDAKNVWAVGENGTIIKTGNGGLWWNAQTSGTDRELRGIGVADNRTAWAVGADGTILKTIDGGTNWYAQVCPVAGANLYAISVVDTTTAWAAGGGGVVLHTTDGGDGAPGNLAITSITPASGMQYNASVKITDLAGSGFKPGAQVRLEMDGKVLNASAVNVLSGEKITCTLNLFSAQPGAYDIVVKNADGTEARMAGGFTVTSACGQGSGAGALALGVAMGLLSAAGTVHRRRRKRASTRGRE